MSSVRDELTTIEGWIELDKVMQRQGPVESCWMGKVDGIRLGFLRLLSPV